ncbi:MAG: CARDB domain-containing protein [Candidatus Bathycorpusculaceae bacterium]
MVLSKSAMTKLKTILVIDLMIVGLAAGGYYSLQTFLKTAVMPSLPEVKPAEFKLGNLTIQPSQVEVNQPVTIKVNVANVGEQEGTCALNLTINDVVEETRIIQLPGGSFTVVEFTVIKDASGTYSVRIGDLTGTFKVVAPSPT